MATRAPARRVGVRVGICAGALLGIALALAAPSAALVVGGGGAGGTDCLAVFDADANVPASRPRHVRCVDGDTCDTDGVVNGRCEFKVGVCANSTALPRCSANGVLEITVDHALDNGDPLFDPDFQALQARIANDIEPPSVAANSCSTPTTVQVEVMGPFARGRCKGGRKLVKVVTRSMPINGREQRDLDTLRLSCEPAPTGCTPRALFTGTFDRVQRQIFNQSCAVSGCHDSQSQTGDLLLETGAAYTNLVGVIPLNGAAAAAGWKRITLLDPTTGDPATSLLLHKLLGPPPGFGARMPFGRPKLDQKLIDLVQLWIAAGAPQTGWVPGTD